jgi:uncharacterized membrane protein
MAANPRHILFLVSILLKGLFALLECLSGLTLYFATPEALQNLTSFLLHNKLVANPHDFLAKIVLGFMQDFSVDYKVLISLYLILHGLVKIGVIAGLLSGKRWSYPTGLVALGLFIVYQLNRYAMSHAPALLVISVFDAFIMLLVWREWQEAKLEHGWS